MEKNLQFVLFLLINFYLVDIRTSIIYNDGLLPPNALSIDYINEKNTNNETPLHKAVTAGYDRIVELLLTRGADINVQNNHGFTPLHLAASENMLNIAKTILNSKDIKSKSVFGLNIQNRDGNTALHLAVQGNFIHLTKLLVKNGFSVAIKNNQGNTPLHIALNNRNMEIIQALLLTKVPEIKDTSEDDYENYK